MILQVYDITFSSGNQAFYYFSAGFFGIFRGFLNIFSSSHQLVKLSYRYSFCSRTEDTCLIPFAFYRFFRPPLRGLAFALRTTGILTDDRCRRSKCKLSEKACALFAGCGGVFVLLGGVSRPGARGDFAPPNKQKTPPRGRAGEKHAVYQIVSTFSRLVLPERPVCPAVTMIRSFVWRCRASLAALAAR